ncbi:MAG: hypothetical protein J2O46_08620 [Nocardioides sp.]|nr:hypothetical protein [Nocardioides sp.]
MSSRRRQRLVVIVALALFVMSFSAWPRTDDPRARADAQAQSDAYQPFQCRAGTSGQGHRQNLTLDNGSGGFNASGHMYPCVSGVEWTFSAGDVNSSGSTVVASINKVYAQQAPAMSFAAAGSRSDLYQLSFDSLVFNSAATNIRLGANSASTYASPKPATPYNLTITPDGPITIGGSGVTTEVWATGASSFTVPASQLPCLGVVVFGVCGGLGGTLLCAAVGTVHGNNCQIQLSTFGSNLVQLLTKGSNWSIIGLDLHFDYLVTHRPNPSDPYTQQPVDGSGNPLSSIQLPNTTVNVG